MRWMASMGDTTGVLTRARIQRGSSGTRETQMFPYVQLKYIRYRGRIANSEQTRDRLLGVLVDHSTGVPVIAGTGRWGSGTQSDPLQGR